MNVLHIITFVVVSTIFNFVVIVIVVNFHVHKIVFFIFVVF